MPASTTPIILYRGFRDAGRHVWSPFVIKLELRLRLGNQPYTVGAGSPRGAPTGKIPYVDMSGVSGSGSPQFVGDSTLIGAALEAAGALAPLNARLGPAAAATDATVRALCEDRVYFFGVRERWLDPVNFYVQRDHVMWAVPWPARVAVGYLAWRKMAAGLQVQGTGRFGDGEFDAMRREAWAHLAGMLGEARRGKGPGEVFWVLGGAEATEADCTVFGFVVSALIAESGPATRDIVRGLPVLVEYAARIHDKYFPDYEKFV